MRYAWFGFMASLALSVPSATAARRTQDGKNPRVHADLLKICLVYYGRDWIDPDKVVTKDEVVTDIAAVLNQSGDFLTANENFVRGVNRKIHELAAPNAASSVSHPSQIIIDLWRAMDSARDLRNYTPNVTALNELVGMYSSELSALGFDLNQINRELKELKRRSDFQSELEATLKPLEAPFPRTKKNDWAYRIITHWRAAGILVGYPGGNYVGNLLLSRGEIAVETYQIVERLSSVLEGWPLFANIDDPDLRQDMVELAASYRPDIGNISRLIDNFRGELTYLGIDPKALKGKLLGPYGGTAPKPEDDQP